jgi:lambda family phage portal protein
MKKKRSALQTILSPVASFLNGIVGGGYNATDPTRKLIPRGSLYPNKSSANTLLSGSLPTLRTYCRQLERNNATARAGVEALVGLVVGSGIALEPEAGDDTKNGKIRDAFWSWLRSVGVDGSDIYRLQALGFRDVVVAGEALWRLVPGDGRIPLRVLPLEGEWLSETQASAPENGCTLVAGVELDKYGQPTAYYLAPPEMGKTEKVPAKDVLHAFERRRPLQARGEPWFAPIIETLMNERDLVDAELKAAVNTAGIAIVVTSENHGALDTDTNGTTEDPAASIGVGAVARLFPGEDAKSFANTRPSQQIAPFRQMLRGDIAAALRIPQRYLDRDVSRANYSSMRADMLDTDRLLAPVREWYGHQTIGRLYQIAAPYLSAICGFPVDPTKYRLLPDAQPYVDPVKDIAGAVAAITAGLSTHEAEISKRGGDVRQVWTQLKAEQELAAQLGIKIDLSGTNAPAPQSSVGEVATDPNKVKPDAEMEDKEEDDEEDQAEAERRDEIRHRRALEIARASVPPPAPPPVFNMAAPIVNVAPSAPAAVEIRNEIPAQAAPVVNVTTPAPSVEIRQEAQAQPFVNVTVQSATPDITVQPSTAAVTVENTVEVPARTIKAVPQRDGSVLMTPQE